MLASSQTVAPKPAALPLAAQPATTGANPAGGPSFAQFLNTQASVMPPPAQPAADAEPAKAQAQAPTKAEPEPAPQNTTAAQRSTAPAPKPAGQARAGQPAGKADAKADGKKADAAASTDGQAVGGASAAKDGDEDDTPDTPELKEFTQLIGLATPAPAQPDAAAAAQGGAHHGHAKTTARPDDEAAPARDARRGSAVDAGARAADTAQAADAPRGKAAEPQGDKPAARATATELLQAASAPASAPGAHPSAPDATASSFAAALAQALPAAAAPADGTPAATYAQLQAPLHSQAFAPEVGARVSLLAVDGVQQAELQLNPADMGPVSVQIVVDGGQAQVSFHAAQAETRQALEQSLPDLAAALQGQGLTLSGGGVFQQAARDPGNGGGDADRDESRSGRAAGSSRVGGVGGSAGAAPAATRRSVGLLDTFA